MSDKTRCISVGWVSVIGLPAGGWVVTRVVEHYGTNPIGALQIGEK
jgi:hypothetical protein